MGGAVVGGGVVGGGVVCGRVVGVMVIVGVDVGSKVVVVVAKVVVGSLLITSEGLLIFPSMFMLVVFQAPTATKDKRKNKTSHEFLFSKCFRTVSPICSNILKSPT